MPTVQVNFLPFDFEYSKTCVKRPISKRSNIVFKTNYRLMQVKSIAKYSKGEHSATRSTFSKLPFVIKTFVLSILSGRFTQVLLYIANTILYFIIHCINILLVMHASISYATCAWQEMYQLSIKLCSFLFR